MRDAIDHMRTHAKENPTIGDVAHEVGMSASRFEHAFAEWVGISPKRFLAQLAKERAKNNLVGAKDILTAAYSSGLSGPGRLHDLLVTYEAVSPGEFKKGTIDITYGIHRSPFGWCVIGVTKRGICQLSFIETESEREAENIIRTAWPHAQITRDQVHTKTYIQKIFGGTNSSKNSARAAKRPLHLLIKGTNFQIKVWEALLAIPQGKTKSYADIARAIHEPKAVRAVGTACGKNLIPFIIPCHRVLASNGGLGGYSAGGIKRKAAILTAEAVIK